MPARQIEISKEEFAEFKEVPRNTGHFHDKEYFFFYTGEKGTILYTGEPRLLKVRGERETRETPPAKRLTRNQRKRKARKR